MILPAHSSFAVDTRQACDASATAQVEPDGGARQAGRAIKLFCHLGSAGNRRGAWDAWKRRQVSVRDAGGAA